MMNVTIDVKISSLTNLLNQKEPIIPMTIPIAGPPPASLKKFAVTPIGVASKPFSRLKNT